MKTQTLLGPCSNERETPGVRNQNPVDLNIMLEDKSNIDEPPPSTDGIIVQVLEVEEIICSTPVNF